ncbi:DUF6897 domain-containing protein [Haloplasma contractile]|uniref:Uncharacterized protein n=1 Tax=Haloplasma contractile SSD-17B TaxID=1033810 RepID=U2FDE6_9MOLU|nr:hypothetical protein [Haloplasma contractile]ERJ11005.1 hypothetical protein HLPCO_002958 [Haloplasma contractile SSD-17B]
MNPIVWVGVYLPIVVLLFVILPRQQMMQKHFIKKRNKRKGVFNMTNEFIKKYIGKKCKISTGSFGTHVQGEIIAVNEHWIEVKTKKGIELINTEFIQIIKFDA